MVQGKYSVIVTLLAHFLSVHQITESTGQTKSNHSGFKKSFRGVTMFLVTTTPHGLEFANQCLTQI